MEAIKKYYRDEVKRLMSEEHIISRLDRNCATSINSIDFLIEQNPDNNNVREIQKLLIKISKHINKLNNNKS